MINLSFNQICVLSAISTKDSYGLEIVEEVKKESGIKLVLGSLYNILHKLEKEGLVKSYWGEETAERGGNRRKYYKITAKGETTLNEAQFGLAKLWGWGDLLKNLFSQINTSFELSFKFSYFAFFLLIISINTYGYNSDCVLNEDNFLNHPLQTIILKFCLISLLTTFFHFILVFGIGNRYINKLSIETHDSHYFPNNKIFKLYSLYLKNIDVIEKVLFSSCFVLMIYVVIYVILFFSDITGIHEIYIFILINLGAFVFGYIDKKITKYASLIYNLLFRSQFDEEQIIESLLFHLPHGRKEEVIGDLLEYNEHLKKEGVSNFKRRLIICWQILMMFYAMTRITLSDFVKPKKEKAD